MPWSYDAVPFVFNEESAPVPSVERMEIIDALFIRLTEDGYVEANIWLASWFGRVNS